MDSLSPRILIDDIVYPEGLRWHAGALWFSDMLATRVYRVDPATAHAEAVAALDDLPSGLGFLPDGRLLIAAMRTRRLLRRDPQGLSVVADLSEACTLLNDMVTDGRGRSYLDALADDPVAGGLLLVEPDGRHRVVARDLAMPNGLAITPDGGTLLVSEMFARRVLAFPIRDDGSLGDPRVFADLGEGAPDGLCLDAAGGLWVGLPFQGRFRRVEESGRVTHEIPCPGRWAIAPAMGGTDRRMLFLATAEVTIETMTARLADPDASGPCRGWIEVADGAPAPGAGWP